MGSKIHVAGGILSVSYAFVPALWDAPDSTMVRQWRTVYNRGANAAPLLSVISTASFGFLSFKLVKTLNQGKAEAYALAALSTISIVPYTLLVMASTNKKLKDKAAQADKEKKKAENRISKDERGNTELVKDLVVRWQLLNAGRGVFPLVGALLGLYTTLV